MMRNQKTWLLKWTKSTLSNLPSEQAVGTINYELNIRGRMELDAVSSCLLKGKVYDLLDIHPACEFQKHKIGESHQSTSLLQHGKRSSEISMKLDWIRNKLSP